jgi:hypothetical protein
LRKAGESLIQHQQLVEVGMAGGVAVIELDLLFGAVALGGAALASVIDEDAPHNDTRHGQEVGAALPFNSLVTQELEECLVHESRGLERMIQALAPHVLSGAGMKVVVEQFGEDGFGLAVAPAQGSELIRDFADRWRHKPSWMEEIVPLLKGKLRIPVQ